MARNGDVMRSDRLKQVMQQIDPNFDERNAGFNRFSKFVLEAGHEGRGHGDQARQRPVRGRARHGDRGAGGRRAGAAAPRAASLARVGSRAKAGSLAKAARTAGAAGAAGVAAGRGDRAPESGREPSTREQPAAAARPRATDGALSLARAFQLMAQALAELRGPVNQEALRLRMAALHGREDALLDSARFPRLLRQANDAEIADVRKVGEDDYEITARRTGGVAPALPAPSSRRRRPPKPRAESGESVEVGEAAPEAAASGRDNGQRFGVRFRRGSSGALRAGEIPLIGVVQMDAPTDAAPAAAASPDGRSGGDGRRDGGAGRAHQARAEEEEGRRPPPRRPRRRRPRPHPTMRSRRPRRRR